MYKCKRCGMEFDLWSSAFILVHKCKDGKSNLCVDDEHPEIKGFDKYKKVWGNKMKLKTLKDLKSKLMMYGNEEAICYELKAEAVKWVKDDIEGYPDIYSNLDDLNAIKRWIKHFFNLTEEEIKDGNI